MLNEVHSYAIAFPCIYGHFESSGSVREYEKMIQAHEQPAKEYVTTVNKQVSFEVEAIVAGAENDLIGNTDIIIRNRIGN